MCALFKVAGSAQAAWATYDLAADLVGSGTSTTGIVVSGSELSAVGVGSEVRATDGLALFTAAGTSSRFKELAFDPTKQTLQSPWTSVASLVGGGGGVVGVATSSSGSGVFSAVFPSQFTTWGPSSAEPLRSLVVDSTSAYFVRDSGSYSVACRSGVGMGSFSCHSVAMSDRTAALALGAGNTLYASVTRAGSSVIQVRDSLTLALRDEIPLPGTVGACTSLMPTCLSGNPVLGCVDSVGTIVFISTDARGIDTTADWPMEGHDPGKTFNTSTSLAPYACP
ncbi:MAG: hypothetical protein JNJ54_37430 [Myxococcaceae bacterium]|nr:hypothetical protein [Myxococcaceae bacterium]